MQNYFLSQYCYVTLVNTILKGLTDVCYLNQLDSLAKRWLSH